MLTQKILSKSKQAGMRLIIIIMATLALSACGEESLSLEEHMQRALTWQSDGDLKAAVIEMKNTLIAYPDSQDARHLLGRIYLELGMGFAAEKEFNKAEKLGIDQNMVILPLAESWLLQRKYDSIIERISYEPGQVTSVALRKWNFLGAAHLGKGNLSMAEGYFDEVLQTIPGNMRALVGKARISFIKKDIKNTDKYIALAKAILPNDQELLELRASRSWIAKNFEEVEGYYSKLVEYYPGFYINEIYLAWAKLINGKPDEAEKILIKFRKIVPENGLVNYVSALHAVMSKNYPEAKIYAEKALLKAPGDLRTKFIAATATFALGENEQSYSYIQQYLEAIPDDMRAKELLVQLQVRLNRNEEAYATLKDISNQAENKEKFLNILAGYELQKGDIEQARLHLEQSLEENPEQVQSRQNLALLKIAEGEVEDGLREMEKALEGVSDDYKRKMQRAKTLVLASRYTEAIEGCRELQKIDSGNVNGYLCEGTALYKKGELEQALPIFMKILEKNPGNLAASRLATTIYMKNDAPERAVDVQAQYLKIHSRDAKATFGMYMLKMKMDKKKQAIEYLKKSVKLDPNARVPVLVLARHYLASGDAGKALVVSDKVMPLFPKAIGLLEVRGKAKMALERFDAAARSFEKLVKEKPKNTDALSLLASAYDASNNYPKLERAAQEILSLKSGDDMARIYLAKVEVSRGKWQKAEDILSEIKGDFSNGIMYSSLRGRISLVKKDYDKAIYFFDKNFQAEKSSATLLQLAMTYRFSGKVDTAIGLMTDWHQKYPDDIPITILLGDSYLEKKDYQRANELYALVLAKYPRHSAVLNNLAWSLYKLDKLDEAISTIRKAREINPNVAAFINTEGEILLARGDVDGAVRQYRKAVDNAPGDLNFKYHLALALVQAGKTAEATEVLKDMKSDGRPFETQKEAFDLLVRLTAE